MEEHLKIVIIGDSGVGKTTIASKATGGEINERHVPTIGAGYSTLKVDVNGENVILDIWDTAGQELYRSLVPNYARGANGAIIVFDLTVEQSFENLTEWIQYIKENCEEFPFVIFGNKTDLSHKRVILEKQAIAFCESLGVEYLEGSALNGSGIDILFSKIGTIAKERNSSQSAPIKISVQDNTSTRTCPC